MFLRKRGTRERRKEGTASIRRVTFVSHELTEVFVEISIGLACKVSDRYSVERDKKKKNRGNGTGTEVSWFPVDPAKFKRQSRFHFYSNTKSTG